MGPLPGILALLIAAAGWFYIFYSRAATNLKGIESQRMNRLRVRLRQVGGSVMILLAVAFYAACVAIDRNNAPRALTLLAMVFFLLVLIVALGYVDLRLTSRIRKAQEKQE